MKEGRESLVVSSQARDQSKRAPPKPIPHQNLTLTLQNPLI